MKLTVVGGGSTYTPELLSGIVQRADGVGLTEVVLHDVRTDRLGPVTAFCQRMARRAGSPVRIESDENPASALDGANFVVMQLRVGGQQGRHEDIQLGLRHGLIGQETTGVGGFAKAMRTIPVVLEVARRMRSLCPDAWLLNFTNPSGMVTEALRADGHARSVGLCNVPIEMHMELAALLGCDRSELELDWVGLNHLGWCRRVLLRGEDILPSMIDQIEQGVAGPANIPELDYPPGFLRALGMIPSSYVRYFYATDEMLSAIEASPKTRAQEVMEIEQQLLAIYGDGRSDELPDLLSQRGGAWYSRLAVDILAALQRDEPTTHIVNVPNDGAIDDLPDDAVVEVPCDVSAAGITPKALRATEEELIGLIRHVKSYERLAIDAAMRRDHRAAYLALVANPLVPNATIAYAVLEDLVERGIVPPAVTPGAGEHDDG